MRSKKLLALALSAQTEILSAARTRAQFLESLMLSLAPTKEWALLIFALIFKSFLVVFKQKKYAFFQFLSAISKIYSIRLEEIFGKNLMKYLNFEQQFSKILYDSERKN